MSTPEQTKKNPDPSIPNQKDGHTTPVERTSSQPARTIEDVPKAPSANETAKEREQRERDK